QAERQVWYSLIGTEMTLAMGTGRMRQAAEILQRLLDDDGPRLQHEARRLLDGGLIVAALRGEGDQQGADALAKRVSAAWIPHADRYADWSRMLAAVLDGSAEVLRAA